MSPRRPRFRPLIALVAILTALVMPTAALAASPFNATLKVPNHNPVTCTNWIIKITATKNGKGLSGRVEYYYFTLGSSSSRLQGNQRAGAKSNGYGNFTKGVFTDNVVFPSEAAQGETLTFHAFIKTKYGTTTVSTQVTPKAGTKQCKAS